MARKLTAFRISIEKEIHESPSGAPKGVSREPQDYPIKVQLLKQRFDKSREQINTVRGIEVTREEQLKRLEVLKTQLVQKRLLLSKYKHRCPIDGIPKGI